MSIVENLNALAADARSGNAQAAVDYVDLVIEHSFEGDAGAHPSKAAAKRALHKDFEELIHAAAEAGHAEAMYRLAEFYRTGARVPSKMRNQPPDIIFQTDCRQAIHWFQRFIEQAEGDGRCGLAHAYTGGLIVRVVRFGDEDYALSDAVAHFEAAIALGGWSATLAHSLYGKHLYAQKAFIAAVPHLEKASGKIASCAGMLAHLYQYGYGDVAVDRVKSEAMRELFYKV